MSYTINGDLYKHTSTTLFEVLESWGAKPPYAVAVNRQFIAQQELTHTKLKVGDEIDVLSPIQGG